MSVPHNLQKYFHGLCGAMVSIQLSGTHLVPSHKNLGPSREPTWTTVILTCLAQIGFCNCLSAQNCCIICGIWMMVLSQDPGWQCYMLSP